MKTNYDDSNWREESLPYYTGKQEKVYVYVYVHMYVYVLCVHTTDWSYKILILLQVKR